MKRKFLTLILAIVLVCAISATCLVGCGNKDNNKPAPEVKTATTYVALDINPSVELILDQNNMVMSARGVNEDAKVLLHGEDGIVGAEVGAAVEKVGKLSADLKYINTDNQAVNITIGGTLENAAGEKLQSDIALSLNKGTGVELSIKTDGNFSLKRDFEAFKQQYKDNAEVAKMTIAEYRIMMEAMAADATLTVENAVKMGMDEMLETIEDAREDAIDFAIDALPKAQQVIAKTAEQAYEMVIERVETGAYLAVALKETPLAVIGDLSDHIQYIAYKNILLTVEDINEAIEIARESAEEALNDVDTKAIFDTLVEKGVITAEEGETIDKAIADEKVRADADKDGKITLDEMEAYLDIVLKNTADEVAEEVEDALDVTMDNIEDAYEEYIPDDIKARIANISEEITAKIMEEIDMEALKKASATAENVVKNIINGVVDTALKFNPVDISVEFLENLEDEMEKLADKNEEKIKASMGSNKDKDLLSKVDAFKDGLRNNEKVLAAKKAFEEKLDAATKAATAELEAAKAERKNA